mgnify:CR=1 FL=1
MVNMVKDDSIRIEKLELGPFGTNAYILICRQTGASVLVDAPGEADKILVQLNGTDPKYILMTHNHMDHTGALAELKSILKVPIAAHAADAVVERRLPGHDVAGVHHQLAVDVPLDQRAVGVEEQLALPAHVERGGAHTR